MFILGGGAISWTSKKQKCILHLTTKYEILVIVAVSKEVKWLRNLLLDTKLWQQLIPSISLLCDSEATMFRAYNKVYIEKFRHISLRHEYVRQLIMDGVVTTIYVRGLAII